MVSTFGNNIVSAFTNGTSVKAIYTYGEKVWPSDVPPTPTEYYISWLPSDITGTFSIRGITYNLQDYSGYFSDFSGVITESAFNYTSISYMTTNAYSIRRFAIARCSLAGINLTDCEYLGIGTFELDYNLSYASLPKVSFIGKGCFYDCGALTSVSLPECKSLGDGAWNPEDIRGPGTAGVFYACSGLNYVDLPKCEHIGGGAFAWCMSLNVVSAPECTYVSKGAFQGCYALSTISLPKCGYIGSFAFRSCSALNRIELPECSYIGDSAFVSCSSLSVIKLGYSGVCSITNRIFEYNIVDIYVPSSLVSAYKTASYWSYYSNYIYSIN